jgi:hypothetical protein
VERDGALTALDAEGRNISYEEMNASANALDDLIMPGF